MSGLSPATSNFAPQPIIPDIKLCNNPHSLYENGANFDCDSGFDNLSDNENTSENDEEIPMDVGTFLIQWKHSCNVISHQNPALIAQVSNMRHCSIYYHVYTLTIYIHRYGE